MAAGENASLTSKYWSRQYSTWVLVWTVEHFVSCHPDSVLQ
jgi:hypothetical protein